MDLDFIDDTKENPLRAVVYGQEGIGKSTAAALCDKPLFLDLESGAGRIFDRDNNRVKRLKNLKTFDSVLATVKSLKESKMKVKGIEFKTLVIDSIDWLEGLAHKKIIGTSGKDIMRVNGGYGAGLRDSERMHRDLVAQLQSLQDDTGCDIICLAHEKVKDVKDPESELDYDSYQLKLDDKVLSIWSEWAEAILFARFSVLVAETEGKKKARAVDASERILITEHRPGAKAKNRLKLPPVMEFKEKTLADIQVKARDFKPTEKEKEEINLVDFVTSAKFLADKVKDPETKKVVLETIEKNKNDKKALEETIKRLKEITK